MEITTIYFIIWCIWGIFYICLAVYIWFSKKPIAFWGNTKMFEVTDIRKYNHAMSKLYVAHGVVFILLGLPFLVGKTSEWFLFWSAGVVMESILLMAIYSLVIKKKYKK